MLEYMQEAKCKIMLCGYYDSEKKGGDLYDRLLEYGWKRYNWRIWYNPVPIKRKKALERSLSGSTMSFLLRQDFISE